MNRTVVVISRRWSGPLIRVEVRKIAADTEVSVSMSLAEFVQSLVEEIGSPASIMTTSGLRKKAIDAAQRVVDGMKAETTAAM